MPATRVFIATPRVFVAGHAGRFTAGTAAHCNPSLIAVEVTY
jgi:hypothetical protein